MPELPEVEVVKRSLKKTISKLKIRKVIINNSKLRYKVNKQYFKKILKKKIVSIRRRSKYLLFNFESKLTMLVHLGMTGKFILMNKKKQKKITSFYYKLSNKDNKHNHIIFLFNNNIKLIYNDVRRFGFIKIFSNFKEKNISHLKILGPEPLSNNFNFKYFINYILNKNKSIKNCLMDQKFVAGLGNIYVNEVLFLSGINPLRNLKDINSKEVKKILINIKKILKRAIKEGGSSIKNFSDSKGNSGKFQKEFKIYGRKGDKCLSLKCSEVIKKVVICNRATFYCNSCQK